MNEPDSTDLLSMTARIPSGLFARGAGLFSTMAATGASLLISRIIKSVKKGDHDAYLKPIGRLVENLGHMKGVAMKVGQILSYVSPGLPEEARRILALLQTSSPAMPFEKVSGIISAQLGDSAPELLEKMEPIPLAAASIGQVHKAILPGGEAVAVKVQYPEIAASIETDFKTTVIAKAVTAAIGMDVTPLFDEAQATFLEECDYIREAEHQKSFHEIYADDPEIIIPRVHEKYCAKLVLTTDFHDAPSFETFLQSNPTQERRNRIGEKLYEFYLGSLYRFGLFNADPHPGNYLVYPDGRLVLLDFGCVRTYGNEKRIALRALTKAVLEEDEQAIRGALLDLGFYKAADDRAFRDMKKLVNGFLAPLHEPGVHPVDAAFSADMNELIEQKMKIMRMAIPGDLLFLLRIRFGLYAVLAQLGARLNWRELEASFIEEES